MSFAENARLRLTLYKIYDIIKFGVNLKRKTKEIIIWQKIL